MFAFVKVSEMDTSREVKEAKDDSALVATDLVLVGGEEEVHVVVEGAEEDEVGSQFQKMTWMLI